MGNDIHEDPHAEGRKVWNAFRLQLAEAAGFLGAMLDSVLHSIRKHIWSLLVFAILGAAAAGAWWYMKPGNYQADMTVSYVHYEKKIYADMIEKLNLLIEAGDHAALSDLLRMQENEVRMIRSLKGLNIRKEPLTEDLSTEKLPFYIHAEASDPAIFGRLEKAIVAYLNRTEFIQERLAFMKKKSEDELKFLEHRLAIADSLSKLYIIRTEGMNDEKTITRKELLEESIGIYARMQEVKGLLHFNVNIEVLDGFVATSKTNNKSLFSMILYGILLGLALRVGLMAFIK